MKAKRLLLIALLVPAFVLCNKPQSTNGDDSTPVTPTPVTPSADDEVPAEVKDGDRILVTNDVVQKFVEEIHYPERDYSYSAMKRGAEADFLKEEYIDEDGQTQTKLLISPGQADLPKTYTIRWPKDTKSSEYIGKLQGGGKTYEVSLDPNPDMDVSFGFWKITNLLPNAHYTYEVKNGDAVVTSGAFDTYGLVHQLVFKPGSAAGVRNVRDLGGWKTKDGKTVKYRMVYRGGRPEKINSSGLKEAKLEGIMAELDLRGHEDVLSETAFSYGADFCSPVIEEGYTQMLRDDKEKTRQVVQFIFDSVKDNKPVYFHCSLGRDRTGTTALLILGILGVDEGDISKEYELTQFAPSGYSVSTGEKTRMTRLSGVDYDGAAKFLWAYGHNNGTYLPFKDCVEKYMLEIGISQEDINTFRSNMLQ